MPTTVEAKRSFTDRKTKQKIKAGQRFTVSNHKADGLLGANLVIEIGPRTYQQNERVNNETNQSTAVSQ